MSDQCATEKARPICTLKPINLHNLDEFSELLRQRTICGWNKEPSKIEQWRDEMDNKTKSLFWVVPTQLAEAPSPHRYVGHIALCSTVHPENLELANPDKSVFTFDTLFILKEHRGGGFGRAAIQALEACAKEEPYGSPNCKAMTVKTISRKYREDDECREIYMRLASRRGMGPPERGTSQEDWYARMGYVKWKEEPGYWTTLVDGSKILLDEVSMRKRLE
ncbi:hypothetical protein EDB81DRAFT_791468 [Dactylonectria macrodidyma]|uniref:N-acetyltransferase domain-containing protein n=1 Tax=Dactylonectria macrodidyma TaxID=307937 RepID=A0A9P9JBJ0_9HYPO|nr:hypothetical protein EDB81DRAFT_791468 [Dactylonectria macrodidyma]